MGTYSCFQKSGIFCINIKNIWLEKSDSHIDVEPRTGQTDKFVKSNSNGNSNNNCIINKTPISKTKTFFDRSNFIHLKTKSWFDEYEIKEKLGEGAYGCVYKVQHKTTGYTRAVKAIKRKHVDSTEFNNEIAIWKTVDHPNIIKLFDCYSDNNYYYMVQEYCSAGDWYDYIKHEKYFSEKKAAHIMSQLLSAVHYLHKKQIVHRDWKPENIVFIKSEMSKITSEIGDGHDDIYIKLIDFGTSVHLKQGNLTQELGTIYYIAPEVFLNNYKERADVWSCGVILYIMLCGHPPFWGREEEEIKRKILNTAVPFQAKDFNKVSEQAINFVKELLTYNPNKRPSAEQALENEWWETMCKSTNAKDNILKSDVISNLVKFTSTVTLQKATLSFMANQVSLNEEIRKLKSEFDKIDDNKDGWISWDELIKCMETVLPRQEAEIKAKEIFEEIDFNNDGSINFSEFITVNMKKEKLCGEDMLKKAFKMFDLDGNGFITIDELKETIPLEIQNHMEWVDIVKEVDQDGDCQISYEEFKHMMEKIANW